MACGSCALQPLTLLLTPTSVFLCELLGMLFLFRLCFPSLCSDSQRPDACMVLEKTGRSWIRYLLRFHLLLLEELVSRTITWDHILRF